MTSTIDAGLDLRGIPVDRLPDVAAAVPAGPVRDQVTAGQWVDFDAAAELTPDQQFRLYTAVVAAHPTGTGRQDVRAWFRTLTMETRR